MKGMYPYIYRPFVRARCSFVRSFVLTPNPLGGAHMKSSYSASKEATAVAAVTAALVSSKVATLIWAFLLVDFLPVFCFSFSWRCFSFDSVDSIEESRRISEKSSGSARSRNSFSRNGTSSEFFYHPTTTTSSVMKRYPGHTHKHDLPF